MDPMGPPSGNWIRRNRRKLRLTQAELAEVLGYDQDWVCRVEKGRTRARPCHRMAIAWLLAEQMGESPDGGEGNE